jgi:ketosteroid isomerase-like protein
MLTRDRMQDLLDAMARSYAAGDAAACAAFFGDTAQLHSPFGPPAVGRAAIEALHAEWTATPSAKSFTIIDHGSGDSLAWCLCRFSEGDVTGEGTSLVVLERAPSGDWLIRSCCLHGDAAAA